MSSFIPKRGYYVYILANKSGTLYTGMTNDLERRVHEHKLAKIPSFAQRYKVNRLVYYEEYSLVEDAIAREQQIKGLRREKKVRLIVESNPQWKDLAVDWFDS